MFPRESSSPPFLSRTYKLTYGGKQYPIHRCSVHALRHDVQTSLSRTSQQTDLAPVRRRVRLPNSCSHPHREGPAITQHRSSPAICQLTPDSRGYTKPSATADIPATLSSYSECSCSAYPLLPSAAAGPHLSAAHGFHFRNGTGSGSANG